MNPSIYVFTRTELRDYEWVPSPIFLDINVKKWLTQISEKNSQNGKDAPPTFFILVEKFAIAGKSFISLRKDTHGRNIILTAIFVCQQIEIEQNTSRIKSFLALNDDKLLANPAINFSENDFLANLASVDANENSDIVGKFVEINFNQITEYSHKSYCTLDKYLKLNSSKIELFYFGPDLPPPSNVICNIWITEKGSFQSQNVEAQEVQFNTSGGNQSEINQTKAGGRHVAKNGGDSALAEGAVKLKVENKNDSIVDFITNKIRLFFPNSPEEKAISITISIQNILASGCQAVIETVSGPQLDTKEIVLTSDETKKLLLYLKSFKSVKIIKNDLPD
jgi:hypothetical protein